MPYDWNMLAVGARQVVRSTAGAVLKAKQDQAANLTFANDLLQMRPKNGNPLSERDIILTGKKNGVPPLNLAVLKEKETGSMNGFARDGRATISIEPQHFSKYSFHAFDVSHPELSYTKWWPYPERAIRRPGWTKHPLDMSQPERWQLLTQWASVAPEAALCGIGVGAFQVMGFHWRVFGFASAAEMFEYAYVSEANQLDLCIRWFKANDLMEPLRRGDWAKVSAFNGSGNPVAYAAACCKIAEKRAPVYAAA